MKSYKNIYPKICSYKNLELAFRKAKKGKSKKHYVMKFEENLEENLLKLKEDLESFNYYPLPLTKFTVRDPKTRLIRRSYFRDRIVHHAIVNILEPIYEKVFIYDSYANRMDKGTLKAIERFDTFKRKISHGGRLVKYSKDKNMVKGYVLKADVKHFFDSMNHKVLINILKRKIKDNRVLWLINQILKNFHDKKKGMPLGNMTSQFLANVYLNELDYFIKYKLKMKYYIRYVDDFVILHGNKNVLRECKVKVDKYLSNIKLELHPNKSKIICVYKGVNFLGYRIFYYYRLLRKRNISQLHKRLLFLKELYNKGIINSDQILESVQGWLAYARWANTYNLRKQIIRKTYEIIDKY